MENFPNPFESKNSDVCNLAQGDMQLKILKKSLEKNLIETFLLLYVELTYSYGDYSYYPQVFLKT